MKNRIKLAVPVVTIFSSLLLLCISGYSATVTLTWENAAGNPANVTQTVISWGVGSGAYTNSLTVPITQTSLQLTNFMAGTRYYFVAQHSDGTDLSVYSAECVYKTKPNPPRNLQANAP